MNDEYEIPEEPMSYWLDHFEDWLGRVAIDLDWRTSPVLQTLRQQVMTRLQEVEFLKEREMEREKKIAHSMDKNQRDADRMRRLIRHDAYIMSKKALQLIMDSADDAPAIDLDELLADVQERVNSIEASIEALREIE